MADALANLKDIHLPPPIGLWPPAYGWFITAGIIFILSLMVFKRYLRYRKKCQLRSEAYQQLASIRQQHQQTPNVAQSAASVAMLLKQIALMRYPRIDVAAKTQEAWLEFLNTHDGHINFTPVKSLLLEAPYQENATGDVNTLINTAQQWIKRQLS